MKDEEYEPIGEVDRPFAETLQPGDRFLLDGRCLEVRSYEFGTLSVDEAPGAYSTVIASRGSMMSSRFTASLCRRTNS